MQTLKKIYVYISNRTQILISKIKRMYMQYHISNHPTHASMKSLSQNACKTQTSMNFKRWPHFVQVRGCCFFLILRTFNTIRVF